jgi:hypothetical protein
MTGAKPGTRPGARPGTTAEQSGLAARLSPLLAELYPDLEISLTWTNPLELIVATILSAQCTDERVNQVTADLFKRYRSARDYAEVDREDLEEAIRSTGFYRNKAKSPRSPGWHERRPTSSSATRSARTSVWSSTRTSSAWQTAWDSRMRPIRSRWSVT